MRIKILEIKETIPFFQDEEPFNFYEAEMRRIHAEEIHTEEQKLLELEERKQIEQRKKPLMLKQGENIIRGLLR